jgi:hypothetical protein
MVPLKVVTPRELFRRSNPPGITFRNHNVMWTLLPRDEKEQFEQEHTTAKARYNADIEVCQKSWALYYDHLPVSDHISIGPSVDGCTTVRTAEEMWSRPVLRARILSYLPSLFMLNRCGPVCKAWLLTVSSPIHSTFSVSYCRCSQMGDGAPPGWFSNRICRGGAFEHILTLEIGDISYAGQLGGITSLTCLQVLCLSSPHGGAITDSILKQIATHCKQLGRLNIMDCTQCDASVGYNYGNEGLASLASLPLWSLHLDACSPSVTNAGFACLSPLGRTLTTLGLVGQCGWDSCWTTEETWRIIGVSFPHLRFLNIVGCGIGAISIETFTDFNNFQAGFEHLIQLEYLETIHAVEAAIGDEALLHISKIQSLTSLNLDTNTLVTDAGLGHLAENCAELEELDLNDSSLLDDLKERDRALALEPNSRILASMYPNLMGFVEDEVLVGWGRFQTYCDY